MCLPLCLPIAAPAHPIDENLNRYEVQAFVLPAGLRLDLHVLHGGLVAGAAWTRFDRDGDGSLGPAEQAAWAAELAAPVSVAVDGRPAELQPGQGIFPDRELFLTCAQFIALPVAVRAAVPRGGPATVRVAVSPRAGTPVLARVLFVAPASVGLAAQESRGGASSARVSWPAAGEPPDRAPADRLPVDDAPTAGGGRGPIWPALLLVGLTGLLGWRVAARRQPQ
ncbi:MAG: hypothetical protein HYU66_07565 [Armatimonadetes bacterium]|nr:hypothetical protein [Armatimonadota bacterium]